MCVTTRRKTFVVLGQLYGLDPSILLFRALRHLWDADADAQPLLAMLCALATSLLFGAVAVVGHRVPHRIENVRRATPARDQLRGQRVLVVGQVAMALVLLVASGLMVRTLLAIHRKASEYAMSDREAFVAMAMQKLGQQKPSIERWLASMVSPRTQRHRCSATSSKENPPSSMPNSAL